MHHHTARSYVRLRQAGARIQERIRLPDGKRIIVLATRSGQLYAGPAGAHKTANVFVPVPRDALLDPDLGDRIREGAQP